jgi:hypothetical protein
LGGIPGSGVKVKSAAQNHGQGFEGNLVSEEWFADEVAPAAKSGLGT